MPGTSLKLYLIRHGVTEWNRENRMQGHTDIPLAEEGLEQARRLGAWLAGSSSPPQVIWSSDLMRARQTADAVAAALGLPVNTSPLLRETMLGEWEGLTRNEIQARGDGDKLALYLKDSVTHRPPGAETLQEAWARMHRAVAEIRETVPQGRVAIVGHGGSLKALICDALGASVQSMSHIWLDNTSVSVLEYLQDADHLRKRVASLNVTCHLRGFVWTDPATS